MKSRRIRHLALVLVLGLATMAQECDGLDVVLELFGPVDLTVSDDPAEQAAGASATEVEKLREADRAVDEALENKDLDKLDEAVRLRPEDPRHRLYRAMVRRLVEQKGSGTYWDDELAAMRLFLKSAGGVSEAEQQRRWIELVLDTSSRVLNAYRDDESAVGRASATSVYCLRLRKYEHDFGSSVEGQLYLQFANFDPC